MITISENQILTLLYFLLAHFVADFVLQTNRMVANKRWLSGQMALHITVVFATAWLFTGNLKWALWILPVHYFIDGLKTTATNRNWGSEQFRFLSDQALHLLSVLIIWAGNTEMLSNIWNFIQNQCLGINGSIVLLGYLIVIWPVAYLIKFTAIKLAESTSSKQVDAVGADKSLEHGGKLIGQFERIIILTLVLLGEYQAIGFLITGKSILRFSDRNGKYFSEYVLVGTMMSYAFAILVGVGVNLLMK